MEDIKIAIRNYIAENILFSGKKFPYADDISFLENGIVDSMNIMEIVIYIEEHFQIKVNDEDITPMNFDSIDRLAAFVAGKNGQEKILLNVAKQPAEMINN